MREHEYTVQCQCGYQRINKDDRLQEEVVLVKISYCKECCSSSVFPSQLYYDKDGKRVY